jgi:hypothetical protein
MSQEAYKPIDTEIKNKEELEQGKEIADTISETEAAKDAIRHAYDTHDQVLLEKAMGALETASKSGSKKSRHDYYVENGVVEFLPKGKRFGNGLDRE